jgi:ADP-ribose pyrophosphatase YjhB (NUDIX family)
MKALGGGGNTMNAIIHPRRKESGEQVRIDHPSEPTPLENWRLPEAVAIVVPDGAVPPEINGIPTAPWTDAPRDDAGWTRVSGQAAIAEPDFALPPGLAAATGVVILEPDGRVWAVAPSNRFGGYAATFPKGRVEKGLGLQAAAIREAFEESGLRVEITAHLADARRSVTYTRYYLARRLGGDPADMGWESQAVMLVPANQIGKHLAHKNDQPVIVALMKHLGHSAGGG